MGGIGTYNGSGYGGGGGGAGEAGFDHNASNNYLKEATVLSGASAVKQHIMQVVVAVVDTTLLDKLGAKVVEVMAAQDQQLEVQMLLQTPEAVVVE